MKILISIFLLSIALFANIGTVAMLKGEATITRDAKVIDAKIGSDIKEGDKIDTFAKSRMQIILNDDTVITLGKNSEYSFDSFGDENDPHAQMTLNRGFMKTITGKLGKLAPERFKLKTKSATIGIRGTGWKSFIGLNVENHLCFSGAITVETPTQTIELPAGTMALMTDGVPKKYKANSKFFNSQVKSINAKQKDKTKKTATQTKSSASVSSEKKDEKKAESTSSEATKSEPASSEPASAEPSGAEPAATEPVIDNTPPEVEIEISDDSANLGIKLDNEVFEESLMVDEIEIEEDFSKVEQGVKEQEVIIQEHVKAFTTITTTVETLPEIEVKPIIGP